jgi:hypothetical protein
LLFIDLLIHELHVHRSGATKRHSEVKGQICKEFQHK